MCIGFFCEGQRRRKERSLGGCKNEEEPTDWFLGPGFYHKSLEGVAGRVSGFPLIKFEVFKAPITWQLTSASLRGTAEAGKAVLAASWTSHIQQNQHLTRLAHVQHISERSG